jgi:hypothetical protein
MVRRLTKLSARPTMGIGQTQQQLRYWNLIRLHLGPRRRRSEFFHLFNLYDSGPIVFRIPNYRPHQTPILLTDRYRPDQTLLQTLRVLNLTLKWPIRRTAAAVRIIHISEQMPRRSTSKSFQLTTLTHVLNFVFSHAVASQLTASTAVTAQTQPGYMERYDLDIWSDGTVSQQVLLSGYHPHTPGAIHQRHGHNKRHRRFRFTSNMLRRCTTCIWV